MKYESYVRVGFERLLPCLADFAVNEMRKRYSDGWREETLKTLGMKSYEHIEGDEAFKKTLGVGDWLKLIDEKAEVFGKALSDLERAWLIELKYAREACADIGQIDFTKEYVLRAVETMAILSEELDFGSAGALRILHDVVKNDGGDVTLGPSDGPDNTPPSSPVKPQGGPDDSRGGEEGQEESEEDDDLEKTKVPGSRYFDVYETAILLDGYLSTTDGRATRLSVVKDVSEKLRRMATNAGAEITDDYRSEAGIGMQLDYMEAAFEGTKHMGRDPSILFTYTVKMYSTDRERFDRILQKALSRCVDEEERINMPNESRDTSNVVKMPNFNIFEAAILHDECMKVRELGKDRAEAVRTVSKKLRKRARNLGKSIPDNYRNISGISSQMYVMDNAIRHTEYPGSKTPVVFKDIVELYSSQRSEYDRILKAALRSCE